MIGHGKPEATQMHDYLLSLEQLYDLVPLERTTIWRMWKRGQFPEPVHIGRRIFWKKSVIERWLESRTFSSTHEANEFLKGGHHDSATSLVS
jgi:prophage regulatory protein